MQRVRDECGDVGEFRLADKELVLLSGAEANEVFFRATDEELDQAAAYPFMKPVFGEGVVFDASPERRREQLHNQALRDKFMRGHAETIQREVDEMVAQWDDEGEIDLLDWFAELTIYTSSSCLIGRKFRRDLDRRFAELLPRPRARHRRHRLRRPLRRHPQLPCPRRRPPRAGRAGPGHHGPPGRRAVPWRAMTVICSTS
jgi:cytochrome P450